MIRPVDAVLASFLRTAVELDEEEAKALARKLIARTARGLWKDIAAEWVRRGRDKNWFRKRLRSVTHNFRGYGRRGLDMIHAELAKHVARIAKEQEESGADKSKEAREAAEEIEKAAEKRPYKDVKGLIESTGDEDATLKAIRKDFNENVEGLDEGQKKETAGIVSDSNESRAEEFSETAKERTEPLMAGLDGKDLDDPPKQVVAKIKHRKVKSMFGQEVPLKDLTRFERRMVFNEIDDVLKLEKEQRKELLDMYGKNALDFIETMGQAMTQGTEESELFYARAKDVIKGFTVDIYKPLAEHFRTAKGESIMRSREEMAEFLAYHFKLDGARKKELENATASELRGIMRSLKQGLR